MKSKKRKQRLKNEVHDAVLMGACWASMMATMIGMLLDYFQYPIGSVMLGVGMAFMILFAIANFPQILTDGTFRWGKGNE